MKDDFSDMYERWPDDSPGVDQAVPKQHIGLNEISTDRRSVPYADARSVLINEQMIKKLQSKIEIIEHELRRLNSVIGRINQALMLTRQQLDKKIDYE